MASDRDETARARDQLAAALDADIEHNELTRPDHLSGRFDKNLVRRAADDRQQAAQSRARAAEQRDAAARDREIAAEDRRLAAIDREAASTELSREGVDNLTGALRRGVGFSALERELDRTTRNDSQGHAAGDALLREVASTIHQHLRSYDIIIRAGGDEFICSLAGLDAHSAHDRFQEICLDLEGRSDATVSVGFAEQREGDSVPDLVRRADRAKLDAKHSR